MIGDRTPTRPIKLPRSWRCQHTWVCTGIDARNQPVIHCVACRLFLRGAEGGRRIDG